MADPIPTAERRSSPVPNRCPAAALVVDGSDQFVMTNAWSTAVLRDIYGYKGDAVGEIPTHFKQTLRALRSQLTSPEASPLVLLTPELCVRATRLDSGGQGFLLLLFERVGRQNIALHNLELYGLTRREHEVALQVLYGLSNRAIAQRLSLAENTVEAHIKRILTKVGAGSRAAFVSKTLGWAVEGQLSACEAR